MAATLSLALDALTSMLGPGPKTGSAGLEKFSVTAQDLATLATTANDDARVEVLRRVFGEIYGGAADQVGLAGGRVNLIGEHVDYPDVQFAGTPEVHLFSMGGAIQNNYLAAAGVRSDSNIVMAHLQVGTKFTVALADLGKLEAAAVAEREASVPQRQRSIPEWAYHTLGAIQECVKRGGVLKGMNILLTSNVPHGAGMSNSAANCVALGLVFNAIYPTLKLDEKIDLATFARSSENSKFAGGCCGWLDQLLIVNSEDSKLTKIDYANKAIEHFESQLPDHFQLIAFNTNVPHVLAESDYSHRVQELTIGIKFMSTLMGTNVGGPALKLGTLNALIKATDPSVGDITLSAKMAATEIGTGESTNELSASRIAEIVAAVEKDYTVPEKLPLHTGKSKKQSFASCLRRMRHQKMSALLVPLAGEAASKGDTKEFGEMLDLEGRSLRMSGDFMITGDNGAQDAMLDAALETGKALGLEVHGRMLGGGGGGNVLLFADKSDVGKFDTWQGRTIASYNAWAAKEHPGKGIAATVITPHMSAGARLL